MSETPDWLLEARAITGMSEVAGAANNEKILAMADYIGRTFPEQAAYANSYRADATPWCGLTVAYCLARTGLRSPFGDKDTERWLWARSFADDDENFTTLKTPRLGCVAILTRSGGGHVAFFESTSGSNVMLRGGNQSDAVSLAAFPRANVISFVWPNEAPIPAPIEPPSDELPILRKGDTGPAVVKLQELLPKEVDGIFGSTTEALVKSFQRATPGLEVDGVVGPMTWAELLDEEPPLPPPTPSEGWIHGVTATVFGSYEGEESAYGGQLDDSEPFVALPDRFEGERPDVEVMNEDGDIFSATISDVGPWLTNDPYWAKGTRPIAEQCYASKTPIPSGPQKGRVPSNGAGIDLSPSLAKSLGISGMGKISWRLVL